MTTTLSPDILWSIPRVGGPVLDPAGTVMVVPVTTHDAEPGGKGAARTRLWRISDGETTALTSGEHSSTKPAISPDGTRVAFVRPTAGVPQVFVMSLWGGEAQQVTTLPLGAGSPQWFPDGTALAVLGPVYRSALSPDAAAERKAELAQRATSAKTTEGRLYRYWDEWLTDGKIHHVFRVDLESLELNDLVPESTFLWTSERTGDPGEDFDISPDGRELVYVAAVTDDPDARPTTVVRTVDLESGVTRIVSASNLSDASRPRYRADGASIVYGQKHRPDFYADRVRLLEYSRIDESTRELIEGWDRSPSSWVVDADDTVWFTADDEGETRLYRLVRDATQPEPVTAGGTAGSPAVGGDRLAFNQHSLATPPEVHELGSDMASNRITDFTSAALEGVTLGEFESRTVTGAGGDSVQMYVLYPPGHRGSEPAPLVHLIHGGPHSISGDSWHWRWNGQVVAAAGYVVAMVNFHGSTSWGQDFAAGIMGEWGDKPFDDIEAATDHLIEHGIADAERMAVTGGSYGGYLTAWITSQTSRYRCAIAHAAVTNLGGMYASDVVFHRAAAYGAEYFVDHERVDRWSPSTHAEGHATPTLVIHGELDYRVPVTQGLELYAVLKAKGVDARLVYYPDENHWILKRGNSLHWYGEFMAWLDRYLKA